MMLSKINVNPFHCPMFIAALFTIAETWKHPKCPLTDDYIKKICVCVCCVCIYIYIYIYICNGGDMHIHTYIYIYICNGLLLSHKKLYNAICSNMDGLKVFILSEAS